MSRAIRRFNMEKKKNKIKNILKNKPYYDEIKNIDKLIGRLASTPASCSCSMCGNPRKHFNEKTRKEIISDLELEEAWVDLNSERMKIENPRLYYTYQWVMYGYH